MTTESISGVATQSSAHSPQSSVFTEIFKFEVRYHLRQPLFYIVFVIFFLLVFGAVTSDSITIGGSIGNVNRNAPFVIQQLLLIMSIFGVFTTTAFVANASHRDFELNTDSLFFSSPIRKRDYILGRFAGSFFVSVLVYLGVVGGIMIGSFMPWLDKARVGPFALAPYLYALVVMVAPNLLLVAAMFFSVAALTRSMVATYASVLTFFVGYLIAASFSGQLDNERLASLLDPFGIVSFEISTRYWTVFERNHDLLPLHGVFLWNRILWLSVAAAVFLFTLWKFRFETAAKKSKKKKAVDEAALQPATVVVPQAAQQFDTPASLRQFWSIVKLELVSVFKSIPFIVILLIAVANVATGSSNLDQLFGSPTLPVTHLMIRAIQGGFLLFAILLMGFYAGEIVWRERQLKLNEVVDSMPTRTWAIWGAKLIALALVVVALLATAMLTTMAVQTFKGYHNYEIGLYLRGLFLQIAIPMILVAVLAFVLQVFTGNKYVGLLAMVLYFVGLQTMSSLNFEHHLYTYATSPRTDYSDMNGYGHFVAPSIWFRIYWAAFAAALVAVAHLLWVRGTETAFARRIKIAGTRFQRGARVALALSLLIFAATGCYIYYNTNVLNHYTTTDEEEKAQADFEKKYKPLEGTPQPRITDVKADVDIYPERRAVNIRGRYLMLNKTGAPISELHVFTNRDVPKQTIIIPGATAKTVDKENGYTLYRLALPLGPGETLPMEYNIAIENHGFVNSRSNDKIVANGTFFNNFDYFPHLGYQRFSELQDRNKRKKYGLAPVVRYPKVDDMKARQNNQISVEADWVKFDTTVSTSPDQIALAPGYLKKEWTANGRRYFHYNSDAPILAFWSYLSARYEVKRDRWNDVNIEIYYDKKHPYNVDRMIYSVKKSLDYFTKNFSPYQHRQVRIVEFPRYARFAQSFPNTIPYSESIGFITDLRKKEEIDYVFYVTAHEVAHQWWAHQVIGAAVQGTTMITETMAQYSALMVMEKEYGRDKMKKFLRYELNRYLAGRGGELVAEMPLMLVEDQAYIHYSKGSLVMYLLRESIGEDKVNEALRNYIRKEAFKGAPYTNTIELVNEFRAVTPPEQQSLIHDLFETITLYDNKTTEAKWTRLNSGKYLVRFNVESKKFRATGGGAESPIPVSDWIEVGVLGEKDSVIKIEKRRITAPATTIEMMVDAKPVKVGIDPLNKLVDRNPDDNVKSPSESEKTAM